MSTDSTYNLITSDDVIEFLKISKSKLRRIINSREIPYYKIGRSIRFNEKDIIQYLENNKIEPVDLNIL